jgi:hypothetical protein
VSVDIIAPLTGDTVAQPFSVTIAFSLPSGSYSLDCTVNGVTHSSTESGSGITALGLFSPGAGIHSISAAVTSLSESDLESVTVTGGGGGGDPPLMFDGGGSESESGDVLALVAVPNGRQVKGTYDTNLGAAAIICQVQDITLKGHPKPYSMQTITPLADGKWSARMPIPQGKKTTYAIRAMLLDSAGNVLGSATIPLK